MADRSPFITLLRVMGKFLPGDYLKTAFYLNCVYKPRKILRQSIDSFYRMDHIYEVLDEFKKNYKGSFSILEFGVSHGYSFMKMLYATKYLKMADRVIVHGFDSFEGLPESADITDKNVIAHDSWVQGQFKSNYDDLNEYCGRRYKNYFLHRGYFEDTITNDFIRTLETDLPILIWIDCDYYTSAKTVFEKLIPFIPSGCVIYFDDYDLNFGSRFTGEAKIVHEINNGVFGDGIELILDTNLSLNSKRIYRFININSKYNYELLSPTLSVRDTRSRSNDSPLP